MNRILPTNSDLHFSSVDLYYYIIDRLNTHRISLKYKYKQYIGIHRINDFLVSVNINFSMYA